MIAPSGSFPDRSRALLESVCKHILDEGAVPGSAYGPGDDLPKLYRAASEKLNLAPSQHSEGGIPAGSSGDARASSRGLVRCGTRWEMPTAMESARSGLVPVTHTSRSI